MKSKHGQWLKFSVLLPGLALLLVGGCHWALPKTGGLEQVFPVDARAWPPPAPPVDSPAGGQMVVQQPAPPMPKPAPQGKAPASPQNGPKPFTLQQCRSMTLENNPDLRVELWEQAAKSAFADASRLRTLPHPGLTAELSNRENLIYPYDVTNEATSWSYPLKSATWRYFAEVKWSPTDALQGYFLSQNDSNDALKSNYQRVRLSQKLISAVDAAFFRLLSLQECLPLAERLAKIRTNVAREAQELRRDRLNDVEDYLRTEEKASIAGFRLTRIRVEFERQKILLAGLMGLPAQTCPQGLFVTGPLAEPQFPMCPTDLEVQALKSRPEAQMEGLNLVNSANDVKRAAVKYFPRISTFYRYGWDNGYKRKDREVNDFGLLFYLDLVDWVSNFREAPGVKAKKMRADQKVAATALAISTEVRISTLRLLESREELQNITASLERAKKSLQSARGKAKVGVLENVAVEDAQGNVLQEEIEKIRLTGEANARLAELQCALGSNYHEGPACP